jgi:hypothetical protein
MAHFAQIENGIVTQVIVVNNNELLVDGVEYESKGQEFCASLFGGSWKQTSYNAATNGFRKQYASVGFTYDETAEMFVAPQPYPSWSLDENYDWQAPIECPADGKRYSWDETNQVWVELPAI